MEPYNWNAYQYPGYQPSQQSAFSNTFNNTGNVGPTMQNANAQSAFKTSDAMSGINTGINTLSGLAGLYGQYQQFQNMMQARKFANEDQAMKRSAFSDYNQFKANTRSAFQNA